LCYGRRKEKEESKLRKFDGKRTETFFSLSVAIIRKKYRGALWALTVRVQVMLQVDNASRVGEVAGEFSSVMGRETLRDDKNLAKKFVCDYLHRSVSGFSSCTSVVLQFRPWTLTGWFRNTFPAP
jgi:hypothetical protein